MVRLTFCLLSILSFTLVALAEPPLTLTIVHDETGAVLVTMTEKTEFVLDPKKNHVVVYGAPLTAKFKNMPLSGATLRLHRDQELVSSWAINSPLLSNVVPDSQPTAVPVGSADRIRFELGYGYPEQRQKKKP